MSPPPFRHDGPGTSAEAWSHVLETRPLAPLELPAGTRLVVVVGAHPDDETLGAAGLITLARRAGCDLEVVSATAGEGSHPASHSHTAEALARRRRGELDRAVALLAPEARVTCLGLPDGAVARDEDTLVDALVRVIGLQGAATVVAATWRHDGHPDHEAVGRAAALAARRTDATLVEYPVWMWHWGGEPDVTWSRARAVTLDDHAREAKRAAIAAHTSQVQPLSDLPGDEVLLDAGMLAHFDRDTEIFFAEGDAVADDALDRVHRERVDPWQVESWYERRKRAITLSSLPCERYARTLEIGCSIGALAEDLARRSDDLLALDSSPAAVAAAVRRLAGLHHACVRRAELPEQWPDGAFDLISVSEVGYFLSPGQLDELVRRALDALTPEGHLVLCHWRHDVVGWPLTGPAVHARFLAAGARVLTEHQDPDFVLHVLGRAR